MIKIFKKFAQILNESKFVAKCNWRPLKPKYHFSWLEKGLLTVERLATVYQNHKYMQSEGYRESLKDAIQHLDDVSKSIYLSMVQVLMKGEMKEWSDGVPQGESHSFEWELFKNSSDTNIQMLVKVVELISETCFSMQNINGIDIEEGDDWCCMVLFQYISKLLGLSGK